MLGIEAMEEPITGLPKPFVEVVVRNFHKRANFREADSIRKVKKLGNGHIVTTPTIKAARLSKLTSIEGLVDIDLKS